jgi:hypothetical protein
VPVVLLHFELWNCSVNVPQVIGAPLVVVTSQFDLHANPTMALGTVSVAKYDYADQLNRK